MTNYCATSGRHRKLYTFVISFLTAHSFYLSIILVARLDACYFVDPTVPSLPCSFYICYKIALRGPLCEACEPFTRSCYQYLWTGSKWIRTYSQHSQCRVHREYYVGRSIYPSHAGYGKVYTQYFQDFYRLKLILVQAPTFGSLAPCRIPRIQARLAHYHMPLAERLVCFIFIPYRSQLANLIAQVISIPRN